MDLVTVQEAAKELEVSIGRVHQFIREGRLQAQKLGSQYVIEKADLEKLKLRKPGRPPKAKESAK